MVTLMLWHFYNNSNEFRNYFYRYFSIIFIFIKKIYRIIFDWIKIFYLNRNLNIEICILYFMF